MLIHPEQSVASMCCNWQHAIRTNGMLWHVGMGGC